MKINYITNVRVPTQRAQGYAIMKMCSEFASLGREVTLYVPTRGNSKIKKDPFEYYSLTKNFEIKKIKSFDLLVRWPSKISYWIDILSFLIVSKFVVKPNPGEIIYTRDFLTTLFFSKDNLICLELHEIPASKFLFKIALKKAKIFFVLNKYLKDELVKLGLSEDMIHIVPSGVEIGHFDIPVSREEAREKTNLPLEKDIVAYTGHLYPWKGAGTLAEAALLLPDALFVFVGGVEPEFSEFKKKYGQSKNIILRPFVERSLIPFYLKSADVLVLPNSASEKISSNYTSPLKLLEYMASGRPIVASDLPSIREILDKDKCVFAKSDNPESFNEAIKKILFEENFGKNIAQNAFNQAGQYSWEKRAKRILEEIKNIYG